jgi:hypothetical protein
MSLFPVVPINERAPRTNDPCTEGSYVRQRLDIRSPRGTLGLRACLVVLLMGVGAGLSSEAAGDPPPTPPVFASSVEVIPVSGHVFFFAPGQTGAVLTAAQTVPVGTTVDVVLGRVRLIAVDAQGGTHSGVLYGGAFTIRQPQAEAGVVELALAGHPPVCRGANAAKAVGGRNVWSIADPYFAPSGYSARTQPTRRHFARDAASTETMWDTADGCANGQRTTLVGTLRGAVEVTNPLTHKSVGGKSSIIRAGQPVGCYTRTIRLLHANPKGKFRTRGKFGSATIRGSADASAATVRATVRVNRFCKGSK